MSILTRKNTSAPAITEQLTAKSTELRADQEHGAEAQRQYIAAAADAYADSIEAARQADAVEKALAILVNAGVTL